MMERGGREGGKRKERTISGMRIQKDYGKKEKKKKRERRIAISTHVHASICVSLRPLWLFRCPTSVGR